MRLLAFFLLVVFPLRAEIIPAARLIDWSGAGVVGGIPVRTTIYTTLSPLGGGSSDVSQINAAIAACPSGQVVLLSTGNYKVDGTINLSKNNVTLRMADINTKLVLSGGVGYVLVQGQNYAGSASATGASNDATWTASSYSRGQTTITMSSVNANPGDPRFGGLQPGMCIIIDQEDDPSLVQHDHSDAPDANSQLRAGRYQIQMVKLTAVNPATKVVSFTPGLYAENWDPSRNLHAWWIGYSYDGVTYAEVNNSGIEGGVVDNTLDESGKCVFFNSAINCWLYNTKIINPPSQGVELLRVINCTVEHCYFEGGDPVATPYGVYIFSCYDSLITNNIFHAGGAAVVPAGGSAGNVVSYNYAVGQLYPTANWMPHTIQTHYPHPMFNLYEGNFGNGLNLDYIHGSSSHNTSFRNRWSGCDLDRTDQTNDTLPIFAMAWNRYSTFVGNVLGKAGYHVNYEWKSNDAIGSDPANAIKSIYRLGHWNNNNVNEPNPTNSLTPINGGMYNADGPNDDTTVTGAIRKGNYNTVDNGVPASESLGGDTLPVSLYLSGKPTWFGTLTFPPIVPTAPSSDPTIIPAGYRYINGNDPPPAGVINATRLNVTTLRLQ